MKIKIENKELQQFKANLFYIGILTLVTVVVWIGFSVYARYTEVATDPVMEKLIKPIRPNLEIESFQKFAEERITLPEEFSITAVTTDGKEKSEKTINPFAASDNE